MRRMLFVGALAALLTFIGAVPAGAGPSPEVEAFCQLRVDIESTLKELFSGDEPDPDVVDELNTQLDAIDQAAPPEIVAQVTTVTAGFRQAIQSGFEQDPFVDPAVQQANQAINQYVLAYCGFETVDVTGLEYEFEGIPRTVPAGIVGFDFTNDGAEIHELVVFRIKSKDSLKEILALPERRQEKKVEFVGATEAAQGASDAFFVDLKPGRYGAICHVPVGTTELDGEEEHEEEAEDARFHYEEGMYKTFKVKRT